MTDYTKGPLHTAQSSGVSAYDEGLRQYMLKIYNYMAMALVLTGLVAYASATSPAIMGLMYHLQDGYIVGVKGLGYVAMFSPLIFVLVLNFGLHRLTEQQTQLAFWAFAGVMGLSLASIFLMYTGASIARVFFITAGVFGSMSLYGYTTKRDLTGIGSFLIMGVWGLIIASIVNMFLQSSGLHFVVSALGVLIFTGLVAYETQALKNLYMQLGQSVPAKAAIMGALTLYITFINLFIMLLRFFGERR